MFKLYIIQKLLSILILLRFKSLYGYLSLFIFFIIFYFKEPSHDIIKYIIEVDNYYRYELFYNKIIHLLDNSITDNRLVIFGFQIILITISSSVLFLFKENKILIFSIVLCSVAFLVAIHNNLRQGTSLLIFLIAIFCYLKSYKISSLIISLISLGFHKASILFILFTIILGFFYNFFIIKKYFIKKLRRTYLSYFYSILFSFICIFLLKDILSFAEFNVYLRYIDKDIAFNSPERVNHNLKILILFIYTLLIEFFFKFKDIDYNIDFFRFLRFFILMFVIQISIFDQSFIEISNRILYYYYIAELGILCFLVEKKMFKTLVLMLMLSTFAINVWSILG